MSGVPGMKHKKKKNFKNPIYSNLDDEMFEYIENMRKEKEWTRPHTIRHIIREYMSIMSNREKI